MKVETVTYGPSHGPNAAFGLCFFGVIILIALAINIVYVIAFCKIFAKAGYHWALGLLMLIPVANFIMPLILGFGQWPIYRELDAYRQGRQRTPQPGAPPQS
jgi:UPF0716 family protein affecting phage T7 exclusion